MASKDFIFGLDGSGPPTKFGPTGTGYGLDRNGYQWATPSSWPRWGASPDLWMGHGGPPGKNSVCWQGRTFSGSRADPICGSQGGWGKTDLEVWRLATLDDPFPDSRIILDRDWAAAINLRIGTPEQEWELCYSTYTDPRGATTGTKAFHKQCDQFFPTVTVVHNSGGTYKGHTNPGNFTFGGFVR